jgi:hypothetical protein
MKTAIRQNRSTALATAALLFGLPRPAAGQTMDAGDHSQAAAQGESAPVVSAPVAPVSRKRLPIFGVMADVGLPDGIIGSLASNRSGPRWVKAPAVLALRAAGGVG